MSEVACTHASNAATIMLREGLDIDAINRGLQTIRQPAKGLYPITAIYNFIRRETSKA